MLQPGERVVVGPGIYRERIRPARGGSDPARMISYEAEPGAQVILRGSRVFDGAWTRGQEAQSNVWSARLDARLFDGYQPFALPNVTEKQFESMDWAQSQRGKVPFTLVRGLVFQNGRRLTQVAELSELASAEGTFLMDRTNQVLHVRLFGDMAPSHSLIELAAQDTVFAPEQHGLGFTRVKGFVVEHAAGPFPWEQVGAISTTRGHHWIIEDCSVRQSASNAAGLRPQWGRSRCLRPAAAPFACGAATYPPTRKRGFKIGPIDILWLDAGQVRPPQQDLQMDRLVAMARQHQPRLIVVDRTVGGRYENYRTPEQEVPAAPLPYVWETCMTMREQWSYKPGDKYKSSRQLIHLLVEIVGKGGNLLLNVGPQPDGQLPVPALQRMSEIGDWLHVNGKAIYGTRPIAPYKQGNVVFTQKGDQIYAIVLDGQESEGWPDHLVFSGLQLVTGSTVHLLGVPTPLSWNTDDAGRTFVALPASIATAPPCRDAFVLRFRAN